MSSYKLRRELLYDTLAIGYAGMTNAQALASVIDESLRPKASPATLSSAEIYEVIDRAEYLGLNAMEKSELQIILSLGDNVSIGVGSKARAALAGMFGASTKTRGSLLGLIDELTQSRAQELGIRASVLDEDGIAACRIPDQPPGA